MRPNEAHLRWILSDGAGALALEAGEPDIQLRIRLESSGVGKRSGMSLALGANFPDLGAALAHRQPPREPGPALRAKEGIPLVTDGLARMLQALELPGKRRSLHSVRVRRFRSCVGSIRG